MWLKEKGTVQGDSVKLTCDKHFIEQVNMHTHPISRNVRLQKSKLDSKEKQ